MLKQIFKKVLKEKICTKTISLIIAITLISTSITSNLAYAMPITTTIPMVNNIQTNHFLIPFNIGRITDALYNGDDKDIVINIQDLHSHEQTQRNISSILSILDSKYGLDSVYVEGATGTLNTEWLSNIKDSKTKEQVLNNLLSNGRLSGGEYFAVRTNKNKVLKGLEDSNVYAKNFERLNNIYKKEIEIKNYVSILTNLLDAKGKPFYSTENIKINEIVESYKKGKIRTDKYIEILLQQAQKVNINLIKYKNIINFVQIISKQKQFKSNNLNAEIKDLLLELKDKLSSKEYKSLVEKSTKKELEVEFYFDLLKKAQDLNIISQKKYKDVSMFFEYLLLNQKLNTIELANDEKIFLQELKNKLATTENEKNIYFLQNYLESLSHYLTNKMSAKEYEVFLSNLDKFKMLWAKYVDIDKITDITEYFNLVEDFYKDNIERNRIFIKNLLGKKVDYQKQGLRIKNSKINHQEKVVNEILAGKKIHVVITGGFHTYGFNKLLEDEGVNYIVITPNITADTTKSETLYKNVFNEEYKISNTTFANRPITEVISLLNKGEIKDVKVVGNNVEINFVSGDKISLTELSKDEIKSSEETLNQEQAQIVTDAILQIQQIQQSIRENSRGASNKINLNDVKSLVEKINDDKIKEHFVSIIDGINNDTSDKDSLKMMLPFTRGLLSIMFGFIKNENVKDRVMSVGAAILETVFLPLILVSPKSFVLLHYSKEARNNIKDTLYNIDRLSELRSAFLELEYLYEIKEFDEQTYEKGIKSLSRQLNRINKDITEFDIDVLEKEINSQEKYLEKIGYAQRLSATKDMIKTGLVGAVAILFAFSFFLVSAICDGNYSIMEVLSSIQVKNVAMDTLSAFLAFFTGSHAVYNLGIDSKKSEAKRELKKSLTDLISAFPNDITYKNYVLLEENNQYVVFHDIVRLFEMDFFNKDYVESVFDSLEPLTLKEVLKGISSRGEDADPEIYEENIEQIIERLSSLSTREISRIIGNIDATISKPSVSKEGKELLKKYRQALKNYTKKYWKLSISDAKNEKHKYRINIFGKEFFTEAVSIKEAFNNTMYRLAREDKSSATINLAIFKIKERIGLNSFKDMLKGEIAQKSFKSKSARLEYEDYKLEEFYRKYVTQLDIRISQVVNKNVVPHTIQKSSIYTFNIVIPGINDSKELKAFQTVKSNSPRQAIFSLVYAIGFATDKGDLKGGLYEDIEFSQKNAGEITKKISDKYGDDALWQIIPNLKKNDLPKVNPNIVRNIQQTKKTGEQYYKVVIPELNDTKELEDYQYVYAKNKQDAVEKAVTALIKASERKEIYGGYYQYRAINDKNKKFIIESVNLQNKEINKNITKEKEKVVEQQSTAEKKQTTKKTSKETSKKVTKKTNPVKVGTEKVKTLVIDAIEALQKLTYSVLFKDNMEYTIVANATDLARVKEAELLSKEGIKVNLILLGDTTNLVKETPTRISTKKYELAYCLIDTPNKNLTVYGYDDHLTQEDSQIVKLNEQSALLGLLGYVNDSSSKSIKILDLPNDLSEDIVSTEVEQLAKEMFTTVGVGKKVINLFTSALKTKLQATDDMIIKPSLVASNLSEENIDSFGIEQINRLVEQGVTTIIVSTNDKLLKDKSESIKNILQLSHNSGLKVMFNYNFDLINEVMSEDLKKWIGNFNKTIEQFKENGGIDGLQLDLSNNGEIANTITTLFPIMELSKIVGEQNVGSFLSVKMPSTIRTADYTGIFKKANIKLVVDYDSPTLATGMSLLNSENVIINISSGKNGILTLNKLSDIFEHNKVSMVAFDSSILESIDVTEGFNLQEISITKLISSLFETTPDGQITRGINNGRAFITNRDLRLSSETVDILYGSYINNKFDVEQINELLGINLAYNTSEYELKGFVQGVLEVSELQRIDAINITFDKKEYTNLLMKTLIDYRVVGNISFATDINTDIDNVLIAEKFREEFRPQIAEIYNILNGRYENKIDTVINILFTLKDNPELTMEERSIVLEGLLLLLLGYARQDVFDISKVTSNESIANIKAILSAA